LPFRIECPSKGDQAKSAQRDLNPRIRHGKAVDCRYLMSAVDVELSKIKPAIERRTFKAPGGS
jgi:hypothetical protein